MHLTSLSMALGNGRAIVGKNQGQVVFTFILHAFFKAHSSDIPDLQYPQYLPHERGMRLSVLPASNSRASPAINISTEHDWTVVRTRHPKPLLCTQHGWTSTHVASLCCVLCTQKWTLVAFVVLCCAHGISGRCGAHVIV
jgi:hypothetical protein